MGRSPYSQDASARSGAGVIFQTATFCLAAVALYVGLFMTVPVQPAYAAACKFDCTSAACPGGAGRDGDCAPGKNGQTKHCCDRSGGSDGSDGCSSACGACFDCDVCFTIGDRLLLTERALADLPRYSSGDQGDGQVNGVTVACSVAFAKALSDTETWGTVNQADASSLMRHAIGDTLGLSLAAFGIPSFLFISFLMILPALKKPVKVNILLPHRRRK